MGQKEAKPALFHRKSITSIKENQKVSVAFVRLIAQLMQLRDTFNM
jgi:hypothetical protein